MLQKTLPKIHALPPRFSHLRDVIFLVIVVIYILVGISQVPFHGDESTYIWRSQEYDTLVKQGNLKSILFTQPDDYQQQLKLSIGSILIYSIGFARDIAGIDTVNNDWSWEDGWDVNLARGNRPEQQTLILARFCSAIMGAASIILFFLAARKLFPSRASAWVGTILLATQAGILLNFRRAMQEGPKFLFLTATLYLCSHLLTDLKIDKANRPLYALIGLASGLTLAAKQDASPALFALYFALALIPVLGKRNLGFILANILYLGAAAILAFAVFFAFMPVLWGWWQTILALSGLALLLFQIPEWKVNRLAKPLFMAGLLLVSGVTISFPGQWLRISTPISSMVEVRKTLLNLQVDYHIDHGLPYLNTIESTTRFLVMTTLTSNVMYMEYLEFDIDPIHEQIADYEASVLSGRIRSSFTDIIIAILFILGGWKLFRYSGAETTLMIVLLTVTAEILVLTVPLPWDRYFLIMQIPYTLIAGAGAGQVWEWGKQFVVQRSYRTYKKNEPAPRQVPAGICEKQVQAS